MFASIMAWPGAKFGTDEDFTLDIIVTVLTSGKLSRLYRRLVVEEGLATSVSANNDARAENGGFWLYAAVCFASVVFTLFFIPETSGKTLQEIEG